MMNAEGLTKYVVSTYVRDTSRQISNQNNMFNEMFVFPISAFICLHFFMCFTFKVDLVKYPQEYSSLFICRK